MSDINLISVQEVASRLEISPATLKKWCSEFADLLSSGASNGSARYTEKDITQLQEIKALMSDGLNYEEVRQHMENGQAHITIDPDTANSHHVLDDDEAPESTRALSINDENVNPMMQYLAENLSEMRQGQMSVLNSQAANRELMGVVIQDNFNLKEENTRLRARMLDLEREMGEIRRENQSRMERMRDEFEAKLMEIRQLATESRNPITVLQTRSGCLGSLFGGGTTQTIQGEEGPQANRPQQPRSPQSPQSGRPPRPPGPPE